MSGRLRFAIVAALFIMALSAGINWESVWLEPRTPLVLTVGERRALTVMGLNSADKKEELTKSQYLKIVSSDPNVIQVDHKNATLIGMKPGKADVQISFSEASSTVHAIVRTPGNQ